MDAQSPRPSIVNCTWRLYDQPLDHFGTAPGTFQQRVCLYSSFWGTAREAGFDADGPAPIFFYTGNESPLEEYVNNTGLMWELGERTRALLVWAEHRYEPASCPALSGPSNCFAYGTTAQALADFAALAGTLRSQFAAEAAPLIVFGGSYGGMLAGWMRIRYPHVVAGAIAASAPVWGLAPTLATPRLDWSSRAIARGLSARGGSTDCCLANVRAAWPLMREVGRTGAGLALLSNASRSCAPLRSAQALAAWAKAPFFYLAEGNFPFPSTYITFSVGPGYVPLPAWPMRAACAPLDRDFGVRLNGSTEAVRYSLQMGEGENELRVDVDWRAPLRARVHSFLLCLVSLLDREQRLPLCPPGRTPPATATR